MREVKALGNSLVEYKYTFDNRFSIVIHADRVVFRLRAATFAMYCPQNDFNSYVFGADGNVLCCYIDVSDSIKIDIICVDRFFKKLIACVDEMLLKEKEKEDKYHVKTAQLNNVIADALNESDAEVK
jgi:hypothetical protein